MGLLDRLLHLQFRVANKLQAQAPGLARDRVLAEIDRLMDDEEYQNSLLSVELMNYLKAGLPEPPTGEGLFGETPTNPIPVNSEIGEITYLSKLRNCRGDRLFFHRLGSVNSIDLFEAVTWTGSDWYLFYLDMYNERRSRIAPNGFTLSNEHSRFAGFANRCDAFPYDFLECRAKSGRLHIAYLNGPLVESLLNDFGNSSPESYDLRKATAIASLTGSRSQRSE